MLLKHLGGHWGAGDQQTRELGCHDYPILWELDSHLASRGMGRCGLKEVKVLGPKGDKKTTGGLETSVLGPEGLVAAHSCAPEGTRHLSYSS